MKKHNYGTIAEVITAMMEGQVFWHCSGKIQFDSSCPNPFQVAGQDLDAFWADWKDWQIKTHWTNELSNEKAILCRVWNETPRTSFDFEMVVRFEVGVTAPYKSLFNRWKFAEPVKPEECWQED